MRDVGPDLFGAVLEAFAEGVESTGKKVGAGVIALGVASSAPVRAMLGATVRQTAITVGKTIRDPIHSWQRAGNIIRTYNRIGKAAAIGKGVYDHFYRPKKYKSSSSSTSSYQQYGGGGDTSKRSDSYRIPGSPTKFTGRFKDGHNDYWRGVTQEWIRNPCKKGFKPKKIRGVWMCVRSSTHKK